MNNNFLKEESRKIIKSISGVYAFLLILITVLFLKDNINISMDYKVYFKMLVLYNFLFRRILYLLCIYYFYRYFGGVFNYVVIRGVTRETFIVEALKLIIIITLILGISDGVFLYFSNFEFEISSILSNILTIFSVLVSIALSLTLIKKYKFGIALLLLLIVLYVGVNGEMLIWSAIFIMTFVMMLFMGEMRADEFSAFNIVFSGDFIYLILILILTVICLIRLTLKRDIR
ncbi:hypothetical protein [Anaerosphaera multitolerans]|uniref:Uncharacterized protein n=1 Tax=Anaerosphaera multitolerans TaxID=2487351 RepID=A0A437S4W0_9FIRM|nr:hypothetical protein [Anaerosphaera multitolerans]RVU54053.1 hypothetical protein EF514_09290 [Anaerosphaera multitolerans]